MHDSLAQGRALVDYVGGATHLRGPRRRHRRAHLRHRQAQRCRSRSSTSDETLAAVGFAYRALGLVVEPSAAVGLAAARAGRVPTDEDTVIIITGSNVDPDLLDRAIAVYDRLGAPTYRCGIRRR